MKRLLQACASESIRTSHDNANISVTEMQCQDTAWMQCGSGYVPETTIFITGGVLTASATVNLKRRRSLMCVASKSSHSLHNFALCLQYVRKRPLEIS